MIINLIDSDVKIIRDKSRLRPEKSKVKRLLGSNEKIKKLTPGTQKKTLDEGIKETLQWFKSNLHRYKAGIYNV
ncbi:MAG: hypothetical protein NT145_08395 [Elusimicrobia bacterium]|nr:hypothetical protein [Elusimicrobiota bacterium]